MLLLLFIILISKQTLNLDRQFFINVFKLLNMLICFYFYWYLDNLFFAELYFVDIMINIFYLVLTIIIAVVIYGILIFILKIITITDIKKYLKK